MSELKPLPCPFCGGIGAYQRDFHMCCQVCGAEGPDGDSSHESAAIEFWNRRAQPAQASNDGLVWREIERGADYIKMKGWVSGLPAQPLITSETGKAPDQGASAITSESGKAGQVLTDDFIKAEALEAFDCYWDADDETLVNKYGHGVYLSRFIDFARAIEQSVLAKRVPQWRDIETAPKDGSIFLCWVTAERYGETDEGQQYTQDVSQADFGWWRSGDDAGYFDCGCGQIADRQHISHWMPLPPPPGIVGEKGGA